MLRGLGCRCFVLLTLVALRARDTVKSARLLLLLLLHGAGWWYCELVTLDLCVGAEAARWSWSWCCALLLRSTEWGWLRARLLLLLGMLGEG